MKYIKIFSITFLLLLAGCNKESNNKLVCEITNDVERDVITIVYKDNGKTPVSMNTTSIIDLGEGFTEELFEQLGSLAKQSCEEIEGALCETRREDNKIINIIDIPDYKDTMSIDEAKNTYEKDGLTCKKVD